MASESSFNPLPLLLHLIAIALGIYLGLLAMGAIAPDLPDDDVAARAGSSTARTITDVGPPWTYSAPLSGAPVTRRGAPPTPPE